MASPTDRKILCPRCDALIATVPEGRTLEGDGLICGNCGAELRTSSQLDRVADKVRDAVDGIGEALGKKRS